MLYIFFIGIQIRKFFICSLNLAVESAVINVTVISIMRGSKKKNQKISEGLFFACGVSGAIFGNSDMYL